MSLGTVCLIVISVLLSATAQVAFKYGVGSETRIGVLQLLSILVRPPIIAGLTLYAIGALLWLTALSRAELSQAYPFVGLGFAVTTLAGWWLFGDLLSVQRLMGILLIMAGIILVAAR